MLTTLQHYLGFSFLQQVRDYVKDFIWFVFSKTHQAELLEIEAESWDKEWQAKNNFVLYQEACDRITVLEKECQQLMEYEIEIEQLKYTLERELMNTVSLYQPLAQLRKSWLNFHIDKFVDELYESEPYDSLWLDRYHAKVADFLAVNSSLLTDQEILRFNKATEYSKF